MPPIETAIQEGMKEFDELFHSRLSNYAEPDQNIRKAIKDSIHSLCLKIADVARREGMAEEAIKCHEHSKEAYERGKDEAIKSLSEKRV